jgi:hypothetical protein
MQRFFRGYRPVLSFAGFGLLAAGLVLAVHVRADSVQAQTKDQYEEFNTYDGIRIYMKDQKTMKETADKRARDKPTSVSKNYERVLIELRAAFIMNNEARIAELSEQLEELADSEQPELDDTVEMTKTSRWQAIQLLQGRFDAKRIAGYIAAYGKDFPDPRGMLTKYTRDTKGVWPAQAQWQTTCEFLKREVSIALAGVNEKTELDVQEKVGAILDRAYGKSAEELKKEFANPYSVGCRRLINEICNACGPTDVIAHILQRDVAELLSNPRLGPAMKAREEYLKKK